MSTIYGDITPRTAAYAASRMLERAEPAMCMARFGQQQAIPKNKTNVVKFRRYNGFAPSTVPLIEGVTPAADVINSSDVTATLSQFGRRVQISDVIADTHEDPVLMEYADVMGELAGQTMETVVYNAIKAGTNVLYSGSATSRITVAAKIDVNALNRAIRQLKRQNAKLVSRMLAGTDKVGTTPVRPSYVAFCHPDLQVDLESLTETGGQKAFKTPSEYGSYTPLMPNEIGSYRDIRFLSSTLYTPWLAAATTTGSQSVILTNGGTGAGVGDVYPIIIVGMDAYATVSLAGANAVTPIVVNPKPSDSDVLGQRGHVGFKMYSTACILNDAWMVRIETGVAQ
jgi:N4-gp56 family major capsid protein